MEALDGIVTEPAAPALVHDGGQGAPDLLGLATVAGGAHLRRGGERLRECLARGRDQAQVAPTAQSLEEQPVGAGLGAQGGDGEAVGSDVLEHVGPAHVGHQPWGIGTFVSGVAARVMGEPELGQVVELDGVRHEHLREQRREREARRRARHRSMFAGARRRVPAVSLLPPDDPWAAYAGTIVQIVRPAEGDFVRCGALRRASGRASWSVAVAERGPGAHPHGVGSRRRAPGRR